MAGLRLLEKIYAILGRAYCFTITLFEPVYIGHMDFETAKNHAGTKAFKVVGKI